MFNRALKWCSRHRLPVVTGLSAACCVAAFIAAFLIRFDFGPVPPEHTKALWYGLAMLLPIRLAVFLAYKIHRGIFRYVSVHDAVQLLQAVTAGSLLFVTFWLLFMHYRMVIPRSVFVMDWLLCLALLLAVRVTVRLWWKRESRTEGWGAERALIVGAGNLGASILRMVDRRFIGHEYHVVGFVDDDSLLHRQTIHGVPVLGGSDTIAELAEKHDVQVLLFALRFPPPGFIERVIAQCDRLPLKFCTVALTQDRASGEVRADRVRDIRIEDLLGRAPVELDQTPVMEVIAGMTVLVTGAGGSIGSELARQIASFNPGRLVLLEAGESPLFEIDRELRQRFPSLDVQPFIGDIKHADVLERAFAEYKPDIVYHAAAYKHVPLMEAHPDEAVLNNVRGTRFLAETARRYRCKRFVMISTDKAVRPTNVMGATKRMCELVIQSLNGADTIFAAVRFGNVLGSNGSVIPIFRKQIESGGPLTVTDPEMTRYFMTIPEAVSLVLQCSVIAEPCDTFVLDMGTPMKIIDLARNMIRLSGLREGVDIEIKVTGRRPGEKLYEELVAYGEELMATHVPKVNVLKHCCEYLPREVLMAMIYRIEELALERNTEKTREILWRLVKVDIEHAQFGIRKFAAGVTPRLMDGWKGVVDLSVERCSFAPQGNVLVVLGDPRLRGAIEAVLRAAGYAMECVGSSDQAVRALLADPSFDAVLSDFILPADTGWRIHQKMREINPSIPVLVMSSYDSDILAYALGIDLPLVFLKKPFTPAEFSAALQSRHPPDRRLRHDAVEMPQGV